MSSLFDTPSDVEGTLFCNDNLERLAQMPSDSVDLIYLDPPFFSNRVYEVIWGDEAEVRSFEDRWEGGIQHYVGWMRERVVEMFRVLKPTGSLYLHCDPHASHYIKVMLDEIFGAERFVNEIVWKRTGAHGAAKRYAPVHDVILYYGKGPSPLWNVQFHSYSDEYLTEKYKYEDDRGRYRLITLFPPGVRHGATGLPWRGIDPTSKGMHWRFVPEHLEELDRQGMVYWGRAGAGLPQLKRYLDMSEGVAVQDMWTDIAPINSQARERLGYPTQKPEALLERIIQASSKPGDLVLDPFCGCGTTVAVAHRLGRHWMGIDISTTAMNIMRRRLWNQSRYVPAIVDLPETLASLRALKPFEFQNWVIDAMNGTHAPRKSGDMGIDGYSWFTKDPIQVKRSESVDRTVVDNFEAAMHRGKYDIGYIVAFSFTKGAHEEVARVRAADGVNIKLVKVSEVMLLAKRPGAQIKNLGPQPTADVLPLPPMRKPNEMPTVQELVASDRRRRSAG